MKGFFFLLAACVLGYGVYTYYYNAEPSEMTYEELVDFMDGMTFEEATKFYIENRDTLSLLDSVYAEEYYPLTENCTLTELKRVYEILKETPFEEDLFNFYEMKRYDFLEKIEEDLVQLSYDECEMFGGIVLPLIDVAVDSAVTADIDEIMDEFCGGFLGHKKLTFFFSNVGERFIEKWNENIHPENYHREIVGYTNDFITNLNQMASDYYFEATGFNKQYNVKVIVPQINYKVSDGLYDNVLRFGKGETMSMFWSGIKDYAIPAVLDCFTAGGYSAVYEACNLVYDVTNVH